MASQTFKIRKGTTSFNHTSLSNLRGGFRFSDIDVEALNEFEAYVTQGQSIKAAMYFQSIKKNTSVRRTRSSNLFSARVKLFPPVMTPKRTSFYERVNLKDLSYYKQRRSNRKSTRLCQYVQNLVSSDDRIDNQILTTDEPAYINMHLVAGKSLSPALMHDWNHEFPNYLEGAEFELKTLYNYVLKNKNIFSIKFTILPKLVAQLSAFQSFTKFLTYSVQIILSIIEVQGLFKHFINFTNLIEHCCRGFTCKNLNLSGAAFLAPPGMGKTYFNSSYFFGLCDTDTILKDDHDDMVVQRLVDSGVSLLTNRWSYKKWSCLKVAFVTPNLDDCLNRKFKSKNDFYRNFQSDRAQYFKNHPEHSQRKVPLFDKSKWNKAFIDIYDHDDIILITAQNVVEGMEIFLKSIVLEI